MSEIALGQYGDRTYLGVLGKVSKQESGLNTKFVEIRDRGVSK
jgi:hypothetical protein